MGKVEKKWDGGRKCGNGDGGHKERGADKRHFRETEEGIWEGIHLMLYIFMFISVIC